ncbi:MAG: S8 family peptidase, partial [Angustibacter sp.]
RAVISVGATRTVPVSEASRSGAVAKGDTGREARQLTLRAAGRQDSPGEEKLWNLAQIQAYSAQVTNSGSPAVVVGVMDSGIDIGHPDLRENIAPDLSVGCQDFGRPTQSPSAYGPGKTSHGTHVAGTIAAARNGFGVVGVAPRVRVASIKVVNDDGYIYPEYAICGFMWAGLKDIRVTNHSYYIDPWQFWCDGQPDQRAVAWAVRRAISWSRSRGVLSMAAAGNSGLDLSHKAYDFTSPNDGRPTSRWVGEGCSDLPAEAPGVLAVAATTERGARAGFSNYGYGAIDLAAPGENVLSTITGGGYAFMSGTSMATPHVTAVAALLRHRYPGADPATLSWLLRNRAQDWTCPAGECVGSPWYNSFFGEGVADARSAK